MRRGVSLAACLISVMVYARPAGAQVLTIDSQTAPSPLPAGAAATLGVSGGPANPRDWVGLYHATDHDTAFLEWRYLSGTTAPPSTGVSDAAFTWTLPTTPGAYQFRLFADDGYQRLATIDVVVTASSAAIAVNGVAPPGSVTAAAGQIASVTVTGGPGNRGDWLALAQAGAAANSYLAWQYLNGTTTLPASGLANATLNLPLPSAPGSYEVRLFADNGFGLIATGPTIVVAASAAQLGVNGVAAPGAVSAGAGTPLTLSVSGAPGNTTDWVGLFPAGAGDQGYVDWRYLTGTTTPPANAMTAATLTFNGPAAAGIYEFRLFANNTFARLATSGSVTIAASPATVAVNGALPPSAVTVTAGGTLAIHVAGGPANATDWIALAASGASETAYLQWRYLNGTTVPPAEGVSSADVTLTAPTESGNYEVRLFANNGFARLAASGAVVVPSAAPATITDVSPSAGSAGTSVTITGTNFGTAQGTSTVWLGTRQASVVSWSDTTIVAIVSAGAMSGTVQVRTSTGASNALAITVITPVVTGVSPPAAPAGAIVTISGSGFGATQGAGNVWLGSVPANVTSWSDQSIVATVAAGAASGNAQVLQGGVMSNAWPFTVTGGGPHLDGIWPNVAEPGTEVTFYGAGFGESQGTGSVRFGQTVAAVASWSDTEVVAVVPAQAITGLVRLQQNGQWSNAASFTVPANHGPQVTLSPNLMHLVVGEMRSIQALDPAGAAVTGLSWTTSDPAVVELSADNPPVLRALAPGSVTIEAGGASAEVTVYAAGGMPEGTVLWSVPGPGAGVRDIKVAVPSPEGVADVFALSYDGAVQAITSTGEIAWTVQTPYSWGEAVPDFDGGLIVHNYSGMSRLDPRTGAVTTLRPEGQQLYGIAVHPDGTVFSLLDWTAIIGIDSATGTEKFRLPLAKNTTTVTVNAPGTFCANDAYHYETPPYLGSSQIRIAGDGFAYLGYQSVDSTSLKTQSEARLYPDEAKTLYDQLRRQILDENDLANAYGTYRALRVAMGYPPHWQLGQDTIGDYLDFRSWASLGATRRALDDMAGAFLPRCDTATTVTSRLHMLRIASNGAVDDVTVKEWTMLQTDHAVAVPQMHGYNFPMTQSGIAPYVYGSTITDADRGALFSWEWTARCEPYITYTEPCLTGPEYHLTSIRQSGATDVVWNPTADVYPMLQLEDDTFAGTMGQGLVVFDAQGDIKWTAPAGEPAIATAGGGLVTSDGLQFDKDGTAMGIVAAPRVRSWLGNTYRLGSVEQLYLPSSIMIAGTLSPQRDGNPSGMGPKVFKTADAAAFAITNSIFDDGMLLSFEFGGNVCKTTGGTFFGTGPTTDRDSGEYDPRRHPELNCPSGRTPIGRYHTHSTYGPLPSGLDVNMNRGDIVAANAEVGVMQYLMAPPLIDRGPGRQRCPEIVGCVATAQSPSPRSFYKWWSTDGNDAINNVWLKLPKSLDPLANGGWARVPRQF